MQREATWLVDGMAAVQTLKSKKTYGEAALLGMINDTYDKCSANSGTRI